MLKKLVLQSLFRKWKRGGFTVRYWDGEQEDYGDETSCFKVTFNQEPPLTMSSDDAIMVLGEAYMDRIIDFEGKLEDFIRIVELNKQPISPQSTEPANENKKYTCKDVKSQQLNIQHHYDLGNDFFSLWLDETMSYSCAYFNKPEDSLYQAQLHKIDHILKKINLQPGEKLLDIGSGWGWLIIRAAQQYNVHATGITLSSEQYEGAKMRIKKLGLENQVDVKLIGYQDLDPGRYNFDKIISVGMFEHVGRGNLARYMSKVKELLVPGGVSLLHSITNLFERPVNSWMEKYIFPGGYIPSLREIIWLLPQYDFHLLHAESLRMHYAMTLDRWYNNFSEHLAEIQEKFGERFVRMWDIYLRGCAASFRVSGLDIHQLLFSKGLNNNLPLTYEYIYK